ncbi:MAG TPA: NUDIX hydrolase [Thermoanaerobaculia bacterium]|nr:NUDIX hydrolase [Thermoanaerobaculia bacterium]
MSDLRPGALRLASRSIHSGRVVDLSLDRVRLPNGREVEVELVHHRGAAAVLPLVPAPGGHGAEEVVLLRQYRYPTGGWLLEIPAGTLQGDEAPEQCARRELEEETGMAAEELEPLGWIWTTPGFCDEKIWLYAARAVPGPGADLDADEVLEIERLPLAEAVARAVRGEIHDGKSVCALLRLAARRGLL